MATGIRTLRLQPPPARVRMTFIGDRYTAGRLIDMMQEDCLSFCDLDVDDVSPSADSTFALLAVGFVLGVFTGAAVMSFHLFL